MPKSVKVALNKDSWAISILVNDPRWKGLGPTVKRGVEAALYSFYSPLEGESARYLSAAEGGEVSKIIPPRHYKGNARSPSRGELKKVSLSILLTNDAEVKTLNAQYRGKNKPTNVLSFPDGEKIGGVRQLGDIAMAYETIAAEAKAQGKALKHHLSHLAIHGTLHLLGHDHEEDAEAEAMEALEIAILARMGIANPYESE